MKTLELLSPAGDSDSFKVAIAAGADAVYFGVGNFNARVRAKNIKVSELSNLVSIAKINNVKTYLTLNILFYDDEFSELLELVATAVKCGIDAIIVQDLGLLYVLKQKFPKLELHASTQFTTHTVEQCKFLAKFGVSQINLSRELSMPEMQKIIDYLESAKIVPEVFTHGAFCVSFSGQCYFSSALYNQAGNRGECVQPCRRIYKAENYCGTPFNLKDNYLFPIADKVAQLAKSKMSLKIEGRIKGANYVWAVTSAWREQIERLQTGKSVLSNSDLLSKSMNRNFTNGYTIGEISRSMFHDGKKDESVEEVGKVISYSADKKQLTVEINKNYLDFPQLNDVVTIVGPNGDFVCTGKVTQTLPKLSNSRNVCGFTITNKKAGFIEKGQIIFRQPNLISDEQIQKLIKAVEESSQPTKISLNVSASIVENKLQCEFVNATTEEIFSVQSNSVLTLALKSGLTKEKFVEKIGRLGGTDFELKNVQFDASLEELFLPPAELNEMRRTAVEFFTTAHLMREADASDATENPVMRVADAFAATNDSSMCVADAIEATDNLVLREIGNPRVINAFEVPNSIDDVDFWVEKLLADEKAVPFFQAILFDVDMQMQIEVLKKIKEKVSTIICDNSGFALIASEMGFKIILGPRLNVTNSYSLQAYCSKLNVVGFVPSFEMSDERLKKINVPGGVVACKIANYKFPLMQSRQCLLKNLTNCKKDLFDSQCLQNCDKKISFTGLQNERLIAIKRPGFYSALYLQ